MLSSTISIGLSVTCSWCSAAVVPLPPSIGKAARSHVSTLGGYALKKSSAEMLPPSTTVASAGRESTSSSKLSQAGLQRRPGVMTGLGMRSMVIVAASIQVRTQRFVIMLSPWSYEGRVHDLAQLGAG